MVGISSLELAAEKISQYMNAETEITNGICLVKKKRSFTIQSGSNCFTVALELDISFSSIQEDGTTVNKAEIFMLPEEFPYFSSALREHPISFPINYSQRLMINPDIYSVRLESREMPEHFAERLMAALETIDDLQINGFPSRNATLEAL